MASSRRTRRASEFNLDDDVFNGEEDAQVRGPATPNNSPNALAPQDEDAEEHPVPPEPPVVIPRVPPRAKNASPTEADLDGCANIVDLVQWAGFKGGDDPILLSLLWTSLSCFDLSFCLCHAFVVHSS